MTNMFQNSSDHRDLALKDKLRKINMEEGEMIPTYLKKFTQFRDELGSVGVTVAQDDLLILDLLGLPKSWHSYQDSMNGRENLPDWENLWSDLVIEEIRWSIREGTSNTNKEEDCALVQKGKKDKGKKYQGEEGKRDLSKVRCFHCHEHGHYASNCPQKKASKKEPISHQYFSLLGDD